MSRIIKINIILISIIIIILSSCTISEQLISDQTHQIYLPIVNKPYSNLFCVENEDVNFDSDLANKYRGDCLAVSIHWALVLRDGWDYVDRKVGSFDGPLFLKIKGAPNWVTFAETCRPIPIQHRNTFADFVRSALARYSNTIAVEIMNEPDTSSSWAEWWLGCWGDDYASGIYYGEFVSAIYDNLKPDYPNITFVGGSFMRPDNEFTEGALSVMKADAASFHYYPWCRLQSEYDYLHGVMKSQTDLPLIFSETGLLYGDDAPEQCQYEQANYVTELFEYDIKMVIYYTLGCRKSDWNNSSIWGENCSWKPAVDSYERR